MKYANVIIGILLVAVIHTSFAQHVFVAPTAEATVLGLQYGGIAGYKSERDWTIGAFYLQTKTNSEVWPEQVNMLYGLYTAVPLVRTPKLVFSATIRAGLANKQFVVFIPGTETQIKIFKHIHALTGMSWRYGRAAISGGVMFNL